MRKMRFIKIILLALCSILFVFSCCSAAPHTQVKAADPVMNTTITTSDATTSPAATTTTNSIPVIPVDLSNWKITQTQAIDTACQYVPAAITSQATIFAGMEGGGNFKTGESNYYWAVSFENISVTLAELGWQSDSQTTLNPGPDGNFTEIIIRIDGVTGNFFSRTAMLALPHFHVPSTTLYPSNGQTNVPINDVTFTWPAVAGTGVTYQFALAQAGANSPSNEFAFVDYSDSTITNAEPCQETLQYSTVYWWEVRPVTMDSSGTVAPLGLWTIQEFATEDPPPGTTLKGQYVGSPTDTTNGLTSPTYSQSSVVLGFSTNATRSLPSNHLWFAIVVGGILIIGVVILTVVIMRRNR